MELKKYIRNIPDFPKRGIMFRDITPLLKEPEPFAYVINTIVERYRPKNVNKVVSVEARGYIFGGALAYNLGCGFIPVRKPGKLPDKTISMEYTLEYGKNVIEIHRDAINPGERILVFDDLLATGGTIWATCKLVEKLEGKVIGCAFVIDLTYLGGKEQLKDYDVYTLIEY